MMLLRKFKNPRHVITANDSSQWPTTLVPEVVMTGRSNVGKSSLINSMVSRRALAYVGSRPGKTRFLNFYNLDDDVMIVDAPGYGYAQRSKDEIVNYGAIVDEYFSTRENLKGCILVLDIRHLPSKQDIVMKKYMEALGLPYFGVLTKADKLTRQNQLKQRKIISAAMDIPEDALLIHSAIKSEDESDTEQVWIMIDNLLAKDAKFEDDEEEVTEEV
ncbi:MAG: YihA family ribosome biogenesis GTP-binding protein [Erysipelothrix sp.]|nr:YihA family ribosome biogenesis GTP-binding protein [Erysipelothrix sp.]